MKLPVGPNVHPSRVRANQWRYADYDGDGRFDLIVGVGDWADYGWDNAFDDQGRWTRGPLHGYVYLLRNTGSGGQSEYAEPVKIEADGKPIDVYGMPSPNLADFDGDGLPELVVNGNGMLSVLRGDGTPFPGWPLQTAEDEAFAFIETDPFSGSAGELRFSESQGTTHLYGDVNGDGEADFSLELLGVSGLTVDDIVL